MAQTPVASRFDFNSREPYLAPLPRQRQRVVKISAILFAPDDAAPPTALTDWLARHADAVLRVLGGSVARFTLATAEARRRAARGGGARRP